MHDSVGIRNAVGKALIADNGYLRAYTQDNYLCTL